MTSSPCTPRSTKAVAQQIRERLAPALADRQLTPPTANREAYEQYLKGNFLMQQGGPLPVVVDYFKQSLALDSQSRRTPGGRDSPPPASVWHTGTICLRG